MARTGACLGKLNIKTARQLLQKINIINNSNFMNFISLDFMEELLELDLAKTLMIEDQ
jgi:hypothetical protein